MKRELCLVEVLVLTQLTALQLPDVLGVHAVSAT